jgi:predicted TIM-barrel fold metal-dependent hydrolase
VSADADGEAFAVTDAHVHFWDLETVALPWLADPGVAYSGDNRLLPRRFDVADLRRAAGRIPVRASVHVEANPANALEEVRWLQTLADDPANAGHPHGIVACIDFSQSDAARRLEEFAVYPNMRGVRQILNVHALPRYDYVGRHFMREPAWRENLRRLAGFGWSFDLQIYPSQVADALAIIDANPDTSFVLNHAGMCVNRDTAQGMQAWRDGLRQLATRGNVVAKLSGFAMFDHHWSVASLRPFVRETIDAFGPARCLFASNFPLDGLHSSYEGLWRAYAEIVADLAPAERAGLFSDSALRHYRLAPA